MKLEENIKIYPKNTDRCIKCCNRGDSFSCYILGRIMKNPDFYVEIPFEDLGESMNSQLKKFYSYHYFESDTFNNVEFKNSISKFFDQYKSNYAMHSKFFRCFTIRAPMNIFYGKEILDETNVLLDDRSMNFALGIVKDFEKKKNVKIHKGSPYQLLGQSYISDGTLLKGFLYVHQALKEDKRICHVGEARSFITLDSPSPTLKPIKEFIKERLTKYLDSTIGILTPEDFNNFLKRKDFQDIVFQLIFTVFRIKEITDMDKELTESDFSALLERGILFDFCQVVDNILMRKTKQLTFSGHLKFLSDNSFLKFDKQQNKDIKDLCGIVGDLTANRFANNLQSILDSRYKFKDGTCLLGIEKDFVITYGFRNFGGHKIKSWSKIYKNFDPIILEGVFNALFFSIELIMIDA